MLRSSVLHVASRHVQVRLPLPASKSKIQVRAKINELQVSGAGVEAHVRYPVNLRYAAEIDERVTEALADAVATGVPARPG
ncbi:MAG TPA: hypothetical protein VGL34_16950 [Steroidobacteraceae bacterium]